MLTCTHKGPGVARAGGQGGLSLTQRASPCMYWCTIGGTQGSLPRGCGQINVLALLHLLDFGSGYDDLLRSSTQRDAHETMQFGVLGMAISGKRLDAVFLKAFSDFAVANFFSFSSHEDQPSPIPGVQISRPVRTLTCQMPFSFLPHRRAFLGMSPH